MKTFLIPCFSAMFSGFLVAGGLAGYCLAALALAALVASMMMRSK